MSSRAQTITFRTGTSGIASIIGFGSMTRRSVGGSGMLNGLFAVNFPTAIRFQNPRRRNHFSITSRLGPLQTAIAVAVPRVVLQFGVAGTQWMALRIEIAFFVPRFKGVLDVGESRFR